MSLRILSAEEIKEHYDREFAQLVPGQFFQLQYGYFHPTVWRIFYVKERRPDGRAVIVHELSNLGNRGAMATGTPLEEAMYRYNPSDCINVLHTTFGPNSSPGHAPEPVQKKRKVTNEADEEDDEEEPNTGYLDFDLKEFEEYLSSEELNVLN